MSVINFKTIDVDWNEISNPQSIQDELIPEGDYIGTICEVKAETGFRSQEEKDQNKEVPHILKIIFEVDSKYKVNMKLHIWDLDDKKKHKALLKLMTLCKFTGVQIFNNDLGSEIETDILLGKEVGLRIKHVTGNKDKKVFPYVATLLKSSDIVARSAVNDIYATYNPSTNVNALYVPITSI